LKKELSKFIKLFLNIDIKSEHCIPTVGAINGSFAAFMVAGRRDKSKDTILFIDPGFPAHKAQVRLLGLKQDSFDVYKFRGNKLKDILKKKFDTRNISIIIYSNPNNPTWMCLTDDELEIIASLSNQYDVVPIEDLSYFPMDFRKNYSQPGAAPYFPSIANYTDNFILLISSSKTFSYAGERIAAIIVSEKLFNSNFKDLTEFYTNEQFGDSLVIGTILLTTGGVAQSVQLAFSEILRSANEGDYHFYDELKIYCEKSKIIKEIFIRNGFKIVYDKDGDVLIGDGFYFTVSYPGFLGNQLSERLLYYGISTLPLTSSGSDRPEAIRISVSIIKKEQIPILENRLKLFNEHYKSITDPQNVKI
jgi:aspartate/methionine/tyrosine aminotransferase